ncbi:MAG: AraC family transcriptional regulator [Prevotella sp.]|nr:AraC family transcriptional regulator [Prevotella sp.]
MRKSPKLMSISRMRDILEPHLSQIHEFIYIGQELAVIHGDPRAFRLVLRQQPPFVINDHRMGLILQGEIRVNVNLVEKVFSKGMLLFIGPGTIINPIHFSDDLQVYGIGLSPDFPMPFAAGQMPPAFNGQVRDFQLKVKEEDVQTVQQIIDTIWHLVHQQDYNRQTASSLVGALMYHYDGLYRQHTDLLQNTQSREQTIFDRFIYLVNHYATQEHQIRFYADKMCLTERYLGTVIRQASGTTAKEWIDLALITRIKVELRHTDKSVTQIAEEMNFTNPSFFSKYFKRLTNMTPAEFREG